jgi:hypothetical protein
VESGNQGQGPQRLRPGAAHPCARPRRQPARCLANPRQAPSLTRHAARLRKRSPAGAVMEMALLVRLCQCALQEPARRRWTQVHLEPHDNLCEEKHMFKENSRRIRWSSPQPWSAPPPRACRRSDPG